MNLTDSQLSQRGSEKLELAILSFFEQFRKMYVGDQAQKTSKVGCTSNNSLFFLFCTRNYKTRWQQFDRSVQVLKTPRMLQDCEQFTCTSVSMSLLSLPNSIFCQQV